MRNLQEQVKKEFYYQKLFWPFTVRTNWSSDLKIFVNSLPSASNFKSSSRSHEQFLLTVGQNNFGNKIPISMLMWIFDFPVLQAFTSTYREQTRRKEGWNMPSVRRGKLLFFSEKLLIFVKSNLSTLVITVRLWNFKDGGSVEARFLLKNQHAQSKFFQKNPTMHYGLSKSAGIVLSKSI